MTSKGTHVGALSRHFTSRRSKTASSEPSRNSNNLSIRSKISGPVELIHTTNMLSYNAPDIQPRSASSTTTISTTSTKSDDDSDGTALTLASSNASSPPTSPDVSSPLDGKASPEPNHLSCYFTPPSQTTVILPAKPSPAPVIPSRAPSHTKKNSEIMARQRSISRFSSQSNHSATSKASFSFSRASSASTSTSHSSTMSNHAPAKPTSSYASPPMPPPQHALPRRPAHNRNERLESPFGQELAKVNEIAEDFGVTDKLQAGADDDEKFMRENNLFKFNADTYISEIQTLLSDLFADARPAPTPMWI